LLEQKRRVFYINQHYTNTTKAKKRHISHVMSSNPCLTYANNKERENNCVFYLLRERKERKNTINQKNISQKNKMIN